MKGNVTKTGYWPDSPDRNNDFNIIPSNNITMEGMDMPLMGISNKGDKKLMVPGKNYKFKGESVMETPLDKGIFLGAYKQVGGQLVPYDTDMGSFQKGGQPVYVYSKDDPAYKKYLKQKAYYDQQKAIYETRGRDLIRANAPENKTASLYALPDDIAQDKAKREAAYNRAAGLSYDAFTNELLKEYERKNKSQPWYKYVDHDNFDYAHITGDINTNQPSVGLFAVRKPTPVILEKEVKPKAIDIKPLPMLQSTVELKPLLQNLPVSKTKGKTQSGSKEHYTIASSGNPGQSYLWKYINDGNGNSKQELIGSVFNRDFLTDEQQAEYDAPGGGTTVVDYDPTVQKVYSDQRDINKVIEDERGVKQKNQSNLSKAQQEIEAERARQEQWQQQQKEKQNKKIQETSGLAYGGEPDPRNPKVSLKSKSKSGHGDYVVNQTMYSDGTHDTNTRRSLKGFITGAPKPGGPLMPRDISVPNLSRQDGGPSYQVPARYKEALQNFVYPIIDETDEYTGYNPLQGQINQDTRPGSIENNDWWMQHELLHHLQNLSGEMSSLGPLGKRPNLTTASNEAIEGYYDRRDNDVNRTIDNIIAQDPSLQFIPRDKLRSGSEPDENGHLSFVGAENLQYEDPSTLEGEARQYEQYIRNGNPSIFPKKQHGGSVKRVRIKSLPNNWKSQ